MDTIIAAHLVTPGMYVRPIGSDESFRRVQDYPITMFGVTSFTASGERVCEYEGTNVEVLDETNQPTALTHVDYPHTPGTLYDCPACEASGELDDDEFGCGGQGLHAIEDCDGSCME